MKPIWKCTSQDEVLENLVKPAYDEGYKTGILHACLYLEDSGKNYLQEDMATFMDMLGKIKCKIIEKARNYNIKTEDI